MKESKNIESRKSKVMAISSFILGSTFWIPLLNLIFSLLAIYVGIKSLKNIKKEPNKYGGKWFAIFGIALGSLVYISYLTGLGMCLMGYKEICTFVGLSFLA